MPGVVAQSRRAFSPAYEPVLPYRQPTRLALRRSIPLRSSPQFHCGGRRTTPPAVEQAHGALYKFIDGLVGTALKCPAGSVLPTLGEDGYP
jgi:hypothetical protein